MGEDTTEPQIRNEYLFLDLLAVATKGSLLPGAQR
jgi:hypothetical protein